jgi:transposase
MGDVEILGRIERRRKWTDTEKAALLAEVDAAGGKVALIARQHRLSESLLYRWRSARKAELQTVSHGFLPLGVVGQAVDDRSVPRCSLPPGTMEIDLPNGARLRVEASVNEKTLSRVFRAMRRLI